MAQVSSSAATALEMRMLEALDLTVKLSDSAAGRKPPRSSETSGLSRRRRLASPDSDSQGRDAIAPFEQNLRGFTAADCGSSPDKTATLTPAVEQQPAQGEMQTTLLDVEEFAGDAESCGTLAGSVGHAAEDPSRAQMPLPSPPFGIETSSENAPVEHVAKGHASRTSAGGQAFAATSDPFEHSISPPPFTGMSPVSDAISALTPTGQPSAGSQGETPLGSRIRSIIEGNPPVSTTLYGVEHSPGPLAQDDASADPAAGKHAVEPNGDPHERLGRIATASNMPHEFWDEAVNGHENGEFEPWDSDRGTHAPGTLDAVSMHHSVIDQTTNSIQHPHRSESVFGASVAEQVFGEIATRVELSRRDGRIDFRLRLDPPGMGTVHVHLTATETSLSAQLFAEDPAAKQALEGQLHTLRETLAGLGVSLDQYGTARDDSRSHGTWQRGQPEPASLRTGVGLQKSNQRASISNPRPRMGVIDVVG